MKKEDDQNLRETRRLMGALLRMPPKPHDQMKIGARGRKRNPGKVETKPTKAEKPKS
jgi:hypothetical protein